ncbi:MAG: thiopurine S-methyltransferase [Rhodanobacter sp.]
MDKAFWLQRWRDNQTGFHRNRPMPLLAKHWPALAVPTGSRVLVPLAGKSLDMLWLAAQGYRVLGVELSPLAVQQFLTENALEATQRDSTQGRHYVAGSIELICGDVFDLDDATLHSCAAVYDRAAVIALPPPLRTRYATELYGRLPAGCRGLVITLQYPQHEMDGPPFSVDEATMHALFDRDWHVETLERRDILASEPRFAAHGVNALHTGVYRLDRRTEDGSKKA